MFVDNCNFCQEFAGLQTWATDALIEQDLPDCTLIRRNSVVSLVGLGPLVTGYVLILPEAHFYSIGEVPEALLVEVSTQKDQIVNVLTQEYGSAICFEHGALSDSSKGGACVDHAHIHIIPGCQGFRELVSADFEEITIGGLGDLKQFVEQDVPYLLVEDIDRRSYAYKIPAQIASQYLRRIWAKVLGRPDEWDWAIYFNYNLMKSTFSLIKDRLSYIEQSPIVIRESLKKSREG